MTHEQMVQIVLDAYDARKETREYFEFFLDPDVEKALDEAREKIEKEFKVKRGFLKFSITKLRAIIKQYESLGIGCSETLSLMNDTVFMLVVNGSKFSISDNSWNVIQRFITQVLKYANDNGELEQALTHLNELQRSEHYISPIMRDIISYAQDDFAFQCTARKR